jgi:peptidoglycan hydrolase-like protein with peptidoglycan-binding domain
MLSAGICLLLSLDPSSAAAGAHPGAPRPPAQPASAHNHKTAPRAQAAAPRVSSVLQLQRDLASLGYLPVTWNGQSFSYVGATLPASLAPLFQPGVDTPLVTGALMSFESDHGLPLSASPGPSVWEALRTATKQHRAAAHAFTYVYVDKSLPERMYIWSPAGMLTESLANTGIAGTATPDGTYPVYLRLTFQVMRGKNLSGVPYADPVYWISYFHGGDAVHGFVRASYGYPQSLGCIEVPTDVAQRIFTEMQIGTLVTVSDAPFVLEAAPAAAVGTAAAASASRRGP